MGAALVVLENFASTGGMRAVRLAGLVRDWEAVTTVAELVEAT
ncbi:hypothetical protein [Planctomonas deserti]|nr:hypothetical protein [Planctomonas deserti]